MKKALYILSVSLCLTLIGCNYLPDINPPEVVRIVPSNGSAISVYRPVICAEFSEEMDKPKTEEAFSIDGTHQPKGHFRWEGNVLYYDLVEDLKDATIYTVTIRSSAEDKNGNNLQKNATSTFSIGSDLIKPYVTAIQPSGGTLVSDLFTPIIVTFSEAMKMDSLYRGFTISPHVSGTITLSNDGTVLTFTPYDPYIHGIQYTITLSTDICDVAGNPLVEQKKSIFTAGTDFVKPTLVPQNTNPPDQTVGAFAVWAANNIRLTPFTTTHGVDKYATLMLTFSKPMQRLDTQKSISISPAINYICTWISDRTIQITPNTAMNINQVYTLNVSTQAKDIAGNILDRDYSFPFYINSETSLPIEVQPYGIPVKQIYQMACSIDGPDENTPPRVLENDDIIESSPPYYFTKEINNQEKRIYILRIVFSNKNNTLAAIGGLDMFSAIQSISFTVYAGSVIFNPVIWKINIPDRNPCAIDVYLFDLLPETSPVYYKLSVKHGQDGIKDILNNYMLNEFTIYLNF